MESSKALPRPPRGALRVPAGEQLEPGRSGMDVGQAGQASVLTPKQRVRAPLGQRFGCLSLWERGRDAAALLPEAPAGPWQASGARCRGSTRRPLLPPCSMFAGRPPLTFPSHPQGRCGVTNPVWVCRLASGRLLSAPQRLPEPPGPPCLTAALHRSRAGMGLSAALCKASPASRRAVQPARSTETRQAQQLSLLQPQLQSQASPFPPHSRSGAQRAGSFIILKPCTGEAILSLALPPYTPVPGGGTEQPPAPRCRPRCARNGRRMSCVKAGRAREGLPCSELFWGQALLPLSRGPAAFPSRQLLHLHSGDLCYFWSGWRNKKRGCCPPILCFPGAGCCGLWHQLCPFPFAPVIPAVPQGTGAGSTVLAEGLPGACFGHRQKKRRPAPAVWD